MPLPLSYPGVYVEEVSSGVRTISGVATSIGLFIGWAARGPTDKAKRIFSFPDYQRAYGGLDLRTPLGYSVKQFFENGGSDAYVIRLVKTKLETGDPATAKIAAKATATIGGLAFTASSEGSWAHDYRVRVRLRSGTTDRFTVEVLSSLTQDVVAESFDNVTMTATDARAAGVVINDQSQLVSVVVTPATPLPSAPADLVKPFAGGEDGDVLEPESPVFHTAVNALFDKGQIADKLDLFNLVCVPKLTFGAAIKTLQQHCAGKRAFLVLDSPPQKTWENIAASLPDYIGSAPSHAAMYFPWIKAPDQLQSGAIRAFPPCGFVAGIMARTDASRGVWKAPAGTDAAINGAAGLVETLSDQQNGALNPKAVNCLRTLPVYGNVVWGARTLEGDNDRASEWKYVPVRRMALFLEESLFRGTQWVVFEPNDEPLWSQIRLNIGAFMNTLFRQGAFQGTTPREAYFVKCDRTTTTQTDINMGIVNIHVGFAPLKPAEFVVLRIQQIAGEIAT
jgi:phage tail sheath protein FI